MKRPLDLAGTRFGRLVAVARSHTTSSGAWWKCACDCGKSTVVRAHSLRQGVTKSCGCLRIESSRARAFGGKRGMHTRMVLDALFAPPVREIDRSEKAWTGAEAAASELARVWR